MTTTSPLRSLALALCLSPLMAGCNLDLGALVDKFEDDLEEEVEDVQAAGEQEAGEQEAGEQGEDGPDAALAGDWFGSLRYDGGSSAMALDVTQDGEDAWGVGGYEAACDAGEGWVPCTFLFEFDAYLEAPTGAQEVEIDQYYCVVDIDGDRYEVDCDAPFTVYWDGWDQLSGDFAGTDRDHPI